MINHHSLGLERLEPRMLLSTVPLGFTDSLVVDGLTSPTTMAFAPGASATSGQIFIAEQAGSLRVIDDGVLQATPFVTLPVDDTGERGLIGVAVDPNYAVNHFIYVYYTATTPTTHNRISRFTADGDVATGGVGGETILFDIDPLSTASNHNGGALNFGPDGKLYIAVGENGNSSNSQTLATLKGKILRINSDGSIPTDNPFFNIATGNNRAIWALGLRNPFTFAFQPTTDGGTGKMYINDVGQSNWEEIDPGIAGANYGWPTTEGFFDQAANPQFTEPLFAYDHSNGQIAITGGTFYNPTPPLPGGEQFPSQYTGSYFFSDLGAGWIHIYNPATGAVTDFSTGAASPVNLKVGSDAALYYLEYGSGDLRRISFAISDVVPFTVPEFGSDFVVAGETTRQFTLNYDLAVDVTTLSSAGAVQVTGPSGFARNATLVSFDTSTNTAIFQVTSPDAVWDAADVGRYIISTGSGILRDTTSSMIPAMVVGDFYADPNLYFSGRWYESHNPDVAAAVNAGTLTSAYAQYTASGAHEGRSPSALFDEAAYRRNNPDVAQAIAAGKIVSGFAHYIAVGQHEGRTPNSFFDEAAYLADNPDVAAAVRAGRLVSGYQHFLLSGAHEDRSPSIFFDTAYYLANNADVAAAVANGTVGKRLRSLHAFRISEGRSPTPFYSERDYLAFNPDVAAAVTAGTFQSGLEHFIAAGEREGRRASVFLDNSFYAQHSPDVVAAVNSGAVRSLYAHFLAAGIHENRDVNSLFDEAFYLMQNPDVAAAVALGQLASGFTHFAQTGAAEDRDPSALFNDAFYLGNNPEVGTALSAGDFASPFEQYVLVGQGEGLAAHA